jgi:hypothetical protein
MHEISYVAGLDLGQASDFTALAVLERSRPTGGDDPWSQTYQVVRHWSGLATAPVPTARVKKESTFAVRHLERFPLGTSYTVICERLVQLFAQPPLKGSPLVVDQTGVGRAVVDLIGRAGPRASLRPITITAGHAVVVDGPGWHIAKKELVGVMQVLLQSRRLQVARSLPLAAVLVKELRAFRVKITPSANETFESWRERDHDDLVLAVALAAWVGERGMQEFWYR